MICKNRIIFIFFALSICTEVHADQCIGIPENQFDKIPPGESRLQTAIKYFFYGPPDQKTKDECDSLRSVARLIMERNVTGGKKLKDNEVFDPVKAKKELDLALGDPAVKATLDSARAKITDDDEWLYYQAAVFDAEGFYAARDLRIMEIKQKLP
jgi:hypothetical protein